MASLVEILLPARCAACGVPARQGLCEPCEASAAALVLRDSAFCVLAPGVAAAGRYAYAGVISDAVRGMKLAGRWAAARPLGSRLRSALRIPDWPRTWVPATTRKRRDRGVDLPQVLAGPDAVPLLVSTTARPDQTALSADQRRLAPAGAFTCARTVPPQVVLVDDVRTTGATAVAAASALRAAGASRVLVVTFAVGGDAARGSVVLQPERPAADDAGPSTPRDPRRR